MPRRPYDDERVLRSEAWGVTAGALVVACVILALGFGHRQSSAPPADTTVAAQGTAGENTGFTPPSPR